MRAELGEGGFERRQRLHRGLGTHVLVAVEDGLADRVLDRDHRILEIAFRSTHWPRASGFPPRRHRHRRAKIRPASRSSRRKFLAARNRRGSRSTGPPARRRPRSRWARGSSPRRRRRWRDRIDPTMIWPAAMLQASSPLAQKRLICTPGTCLVIPRLQHGGARDVGALLAHGIDAAHDHVVDLGRVEAVAVADGLAAPGSRAPAPSLRAARRLLPLPARRADGVVDVSSRS